MLSEAKAVATKRTGACVAGFEPFEEAACMKQVLAGRASLGGELLVARDDRVADSALGLAFEGACDVLPPSRETVDQVTVLRKLCQRWSS